MNRQIERNEKRIDTLSIGVLFNNNNGVLGFAYSSSPTRLSVVDRQSTPIKKAVSQFCIPHLIDRNGQRKAQNALYTRNTAQHSLL